MKVGLREKKSSSSTGFLREKTYEEHPTRYYSKKQEDAVANLLGGHRNANSGATMFGGKSDVHIGNLLSIECKTKTKHSESIIIKKE